MENNCVNLETAKQLCRAGVAAGYAAAKADTLTALPNPDTREEIK